MNKQTVYVSFSAEINGYTTERLQELLIDRIGKGAKSIYFLISSNGGSVKDGITMYNFLKSLPVDIVMHNIGRVNSVANVIFAAGNRRLAVEHSSFMFHGVGFNVTHATRFEEKHLREKLDSVQKDQGNIADILEQEMGISRARLEGMFLNAEVIPAPDAKPLGIIHDVSPAKIPEDADIAQLVLQKS